ncbi:MAG: NifB/NifX family molybdenum-iron cluster-binding protein [Deltaproteobacteria bacterium]|nr:NifB/NifX family molybdenum-iron cluster-binding protein [Deltaproteobacteria bacterium]
MRIAISAQGEWPSSPVDQRFGRAFWLLVHDEATGGREAFENARARNALQGAGIQAAQALAERRVDVLLTGVTGPKAYKGLEAAGIAVYHGATGTAESTLTEWREGRLERATAASAVGTP